MPAIWSWYGEAMSSPSPSLPASRSGSFARLLQLKLGRGREAPGSARLGL